MNNDRLASTWWTLKIALGLVPLLAGVDKFFNVLTNWKDYINPEVFNNVPIAPEIFLQCVGVVEILVGLAILTRWTKLGGYLASLWLVAIAANLVSMGKFYDVAVRDLALAIVAFTLARLTESRRAERATSAEAARAVVSEGGLLHLNL
jgi:uncharacterized membrane protein YphA (DoxX/SURF4 family)